MARRTPGPLHLPDSFWTRPDVLDALGQRDFATLFGLLSKYAGASQTQIAIAVGLTQGQVSTVMGGTRRLTAIDVVERALDGLNAPDAARAAAGLAPRRPSGLDTWGRATREKATDDSVHRRNLLQLGGLAAVGVATALEPDAAKPLADIARALTAYNVLMGNERSVGPAPTAAVLGKAVASAKRNYQACRYTAVLDELPPLLRAVQMARATVTGDELRRVHGLAADAYQVTGSVMLKLGDSGLAALAADRSMDAAERSEDPVVLAASARIVTHSPWTKRRTPLGGLAGTPTPIGPGSGRPTWRYTGSMSLWSLATQERRSTLPGRSMSNGLSSRSAKRRCSSIWHRRSRSGDATRRRIGRCVWPIR